MSSPAPSPTFRNTREMETKLVYCYVSYFCCGVIVRADNIVVEAAPVMQWAVGKHFATVRDWLRGKGGNYEVLG